VRREPNSTSFAFAELRRGVNAQVLSVSKDGQWLQIVADGVDHGHGRAEPGAEVDLLWLDTMTGLNDAVLSGTAFNWISQLEPANVTR